MKAQSLLLVCACIAALMTGPAAGAAPAAQLSSADMSEIAVSYQHLTSEFYQRVSPQAVLDSVRSDLLSTLRHAGVQHATLPGLRANGLADANVHAIDTAVEHAIREAGRRSSPHLLSYAAIDGMMRSVHDRYTVFLDPKEYAALNQGLDGGDFGGIGIVIQQDDQTHYITVSNIIPDGPADKAGLQQDDLIVSIDGISTKNMQPQQASLHLRGREGTTVSLGIERGGKLLSAPLSITRALIHDVSVFEKMLPDKIGYVELTVFGQNTGAELTSALNRLEQEGVRAIVLDLRDNGGGYLDSAISVSSKFIPSGPIVSVEERASNVTTWEADDTAISPLPLAVLVNGHTASASEITSGAIQDSGVGAIVGTRTFGKGVVQTIFPLGDGSAIKITTARYLTPHNRDINHLGIAPDINVAENSAPRFGDPSRDAQLRRAIQYLDDQLARLSENG
ncbi:MAG TPA: S41 family peptidase [Candidatus Tyrphobacter sp.]